MQNDDGLLVGFCEEGKGQKTIMKAKKSDLLEEIRKKIIVGFPFNFILQNSTVNEDSENNMILSDILIGEDKPMFFIKNSTPCSAKEEDNFLKNKQKIERNKLLRTQALKDLENFKKERKKESEENKIALDKQFSRLQTKCAEIGFTIQLPDDKEIERVIKQINIEIQDTESFLNRIKDIKPLSNGELLSTLSGICENSRNRKLVDFTKTNCNVYERVPDGFASRNTCFSHENTIKKLKNVMEYQMISVDGDVAGLSPALMVKLGFSVNKISQDTEDFQQITQTKNSVNIRSAVNITAKYYLTQNMIALEKQVKHDYFRIMKFWKDGSPREELKKKIQQFYKKYGTIQTGVFFLGGNYLTKVQISSERNISKSQAQKVGQFSLNMALKGAGISTIGIVAGKITTDIKNEKFQKDINEKKAVLVNAESSFRANPPVQSFNIWKQQLTFNNAHWTVLCKQVQKTHISSIINNQINRQGAELEDTDFQQFKIIYDNSVIDLLQKNEKYDTLKRIAMVGVTGVGKSYLGNQLIGDFNAFKSSKKAESCTKSVTKYKDEKKKLMIIDTPGFFDTSAFAQSIPTQLIRLVYEGPGKMNVIDGFLLVVKTDDRLPIVEPIKQMLRLFGDRVLSSILIVLNSSSRKIGEQKFKERYEVFYLQELQKKYPYFSLENIFWNYKCSDIDITGVEYRNHLIKLMTYIKKLKPYDSNTFLQNKEKIQRLRKEIDQEYYAKVKSQHEILEKGPQKLIKFKFKSSDKTKFVNFGLNSQGQYSYIQSLNSLSFNFQYPSKLQTYNNSYLLRGILSDENQRYLQKVKIQQVQIIGGKKKKILLLKLLGAILTSYIAEQYDQLAEFLGEMRICLNKEQSVIEFVDGRQSMIEFFKDHREARVRLKLNGSYIYVEDDILFYDNKKKGDIFFISPSL